MDPAVPWTAYAAAASYNRLANATGGFQTATGEFQNTTLAGHQSGVQAQPTTNQLLLQAAHTTATLAGQLGQGTTFTPTGFLSPPSVSYDAVFSPLFHHANPKAAAHFRKQSGEAELGALHPQGAYFDPQGTATSAAWTHQPNSQLPSPFGVLPHESVVANAPGATKTATTAAYENTFNAAAQHFAAQSLNHLSTHLTEFTKSKGSARSQSPKTAPPTTAASGAFFQHQTGSYSNSQQSCIVSTASSSPAQGKAEYRVPQSPARNANAYVNRTANEKASRNFVSPPGKTAPSQQQQQQAQATQQQQHAVATKAQTKIYSELNAQADRRQNPESLETTQSSPISFALTYPSNKAVQRTGSTTTQYIVNQNYRYNEGDYHTRKTGSADSAYSSGSNGPECSAAVPRRPSPLQAHSQASPLGHAASPAYPIYNSPSAVSQVTPPSPLDVTVSRASGVAYPSVITRADGRWEGEGRGTTAGAQARGKYPSGYNLETGQTPAQRQQAYFDPPTASADLAACRGDPMSIVKNLHNLQNCNSIPTEQVKVDESRTTPKTSQKSRRKSGDKAAATTVVAAVEAPSGELIAGRVPPPAHHNNPSQQQQNGAYFELDRWNLPPPKMYGSHNQHQGLMVPHPHHPPPPLPYFPPFHLPPGHHPHHQEFHSSVEITPVAYGEAGSFPQADAKEENPKVIVPDVEEELRYLSQQAHVEVVLASQQNGTASTVLPPPIKHPDKKPNNDPNSGFMASYLKFLQGERDTSPPPPNRSNRKAVWTKNKVYTPELKPAVPGNISTTVSGSGTTATSTPISPAITKLIETVKKGNEKPYNPDDDPRFYPLPKSTAKRKLDDSDSSGEESKSRKTYTQMTTVTSAQLAQISTGQVNSSNTTPPKKHVGRPPGSGRGGAHQSSKKRIDQNSSLPASDPLFVPPRRETSRRRAKDKTTIKNFLEKQNLEEEQEVDDPDFVDSDTDPVWMPGAKGDDDEDPKIKRKKQRSLLSKSLGPSKRRTLDGVSSSDEESTRVKKTHSVPRSHGSSGSKKSPDKDNLQHNQETKEINAKPAEPLPESEAMFNKTGEFVVMKSDLHEEYPPIWRIDGKTLLQKYEPFDENGKTLYRNISTYSGWTAQNRHIYVTVPVRFRVQSRMETIVEFMRDEMTMEDPELMERVMKDLEKYQDSFEVYIQTLISQALDSNFLTEILQEQDEYFLTNVKTIDDVTEDHCRRLLNVTRWRSNLITSVKTYPALNVIQDLVKEQVSSRPCAGCDKPKVSMRIQVYGQPYNNTTLEGCQPDSKALTDKDFLLCSSCGWRISLYSKATHQKYLMFIECAKRVAEKRTASPNKDTTLILNELLADEAWLSQLFLDVRTSWAEIEKIEHLSCESNKQLLQNAVASAGIS